MYRYPDGGRRSPRRQRITAQQAAEIALGQVPGQIIHTDLGMVRGILKYEIFVLTQEGPVYEIEVASDGGQILAVRAENGRR
ncbi:MAG: PepSY domain-containing protein [Sporolactobacillus sp.]|jgi:uncharacterized membrane protein YkoI|nr:PepSY domain-containing protein [Sporolactobacillus sp.]